MKKDFLNNLCSQLCDSLPTHIKAAKKDLEKNFHAILQKTFSKLELVTREEFDTQTKVLARTRKKLEQLEKEIQKLEELLNKE